MRRVDSALTLWKWDGIISKRKLRRILPYSFDEKAKARIPEPERRRLQKLMNFLLDPIREEIAAEIAQIKNWQTPAESLKWVALCPCGRGGQCQSIFIKNNMLARRFPYLLLRKVKQQKYFGNHRKKVYQRLAAADNRPSRSEAARARWRLHRERQQGGKPSEVVSHRLWSPGQAPHTS